MEVAAAGVSRETENRLRGSETQTIPDGNAYCNPSRIQIEPSPAKPSQGRAKKKKKAWISLDFLVRIEPFQRVMLTPWGKRILLLSFPTHTRGRPLFMPASPRAAAVDSKHEHHSMYMEKRKENCARASARLR
jgi:hypothetical protein